jgi:septum formation inhibitor MinC
MPNKNQIALKKDEYLNKPHETIQIEGKLNLLQHKCWNILALHSIKSGLREGKIKYEIPLTLLYKYLGYKAENDTYLQQILVDIMHVVVQGNLVNKDGGADWHAFVLLSRCSIHQGVLRYEYPSFVAELLASPKKYVKMLIKLQNRFNSGYSLKLYEFLKTKYIEKQCWGTTGEIEIKTFRYLMGLEEGTWAEFKDLKKWIINTAIKEINEKTDLFVKLELIKNRQKVVALKFEITENPNKKQNLKDLDLDLEALENADLEHEEDQELKAKLQKLGFGENQTNDLLADPDKQKVVDCADYVLFKLGQEIETNKTKNKIQSPTGYFFTIYNVYEDIDFSGLKDWREKQAREQEKQKQWEEEQKKQLEQEQKEAEAEKQKQQKIKDFIAKNPDKFEETAKEILEEIQAEGKITLSLVQKEAKTKSQSLLETVKTSNLTIFKVKERVWDKMQ